MRMHTLPRLLLAGLCLPAASVSTEAADPAPSVKWGLGYLPGHGYSYVYGVSYDGGVSIGTSWSGSPDLAFRWTSSGGIVGLGLAPGFVSANGRGVTPDGQFIVGYGLDASNGAHAFYWSAQGGLKELAPLTAGGISAAWAISADGRYAAGSSTYTPGNLALTAVRWIAQDTAQQLDPIDPATNRRLWGTSEGLGISGDGGTVVGSAVNSSGFTRAFRWTEANPVMVDLGALGTDTQSIAYGVNTDGSVVVGTSGSGATARAFRWTSGTGSMANLGSLGGASAALAVSGDGQVTVGSSYDATMTSALRKAMRWDARTGQMETVQQWLTRNGVNAMTMSMTHATAVNQNGSVVVGNTNIFGESYIARVPPFPSPPLPSVGMAATIPPASSGSGGSNGNGSTGGSNGNGGTSGTSGGSTTNGGSGGGASGGGGTGGAPSDSGGTGTNPGAKPSTTTPPAPAPYTAGVMIVPNFESSLSYVPGADLAIRAGELTLNGGHGKPIRALLDEGQSALWSSGDLAALLTDQGSGPEGLAELGYGFGAADGVTLRLSAGGFAQRFAPDTGGDATTWLGYLLPEATINPVSNLYLTGSAYYARGRLDSHRGYQNGDRLDHSAGSADLSAWGWRIRADLKDGVTLAETALTPFASYSALGSHRDGFTETGGSFPVRWDDQSDATHVLRAGLDATHPLTPTILLLGHLEASYGFDDATRPASGEIIDLSGFSTAGLNRHRFGAQAGLGLERTAGAGTASLMVNAATGGNNPALWVAASYRVAF